MYPGFKTCLVFSLQCGFGDVRFRFRFLPSWFLYRRRKLQMGIFHNRNNVCPISISICLCDSKSQKRTMEKSERSQMVGIFEKNCKTYSICSAICPFLLPKRIDECKGYNWQEFEILQRLQVRNFFILIAQHLFWYFISLFLRGNLLKCSTAKLALYTQKKYDSLWNSKTKRQKQLLY